MDAAELKDELITCQCGLCDGYFRVKREVLIGPHSRLAQTAGETVPYEDATIHVKLKAELEEGDLCPQCALIHFRAIVKYLEEQAGGNHGNVI